MKFDSKSLDLAVQIVLIVAAVNWGLVAFNGTDLVQVITGEGDVEMYVKYAIAAVGLYQAFVLYQRSQKSVV